MEENKERIITWVKAHEKQLIIAGISVVAIIGIIAGLKNKEGIKSLLETLENSLSKTKKKTPELITKEQTMPPLAEKIPSVRTYTSPIKPFDVNDHIRNLPDGWHHSAEKVAEAAALGIDLLPGQTLVNRYTKGDPKCAA